MSKLGSYIDTLLYWSTGVPVLLLNYYLLHTQSTYTVTAKSAHKIKSLTYVHSL